MGRAERVELYGRIEEHRKRPLLVYVTSKRAGIFAHMATDAVPCIIEQIDRLPEGSNAVDFLIASYGGDPMVAWRILTLLRQRLGEKSDVAVLIPQSAYSAATLVALGANSIVIHPNGHLGPVDMQITTYGDWGPTSFSTEDISAFLDFVRDNLRITDQEHIRALFEHACKEVGSLGIGFTARSSKLAADLAERLLSMHMRDDEGKTRIHSIVENMSRKFQSHAYPVSRSEAIELGLQVTKERDEKLEGLMWKVWLDVAQELQEDSPFDPILELMKSAEAKKLLSPVPQLDVPIGVAGNVSYQTVLEDVAKHAKAKIEPIDFQYTSAIVESARLGHARVTRGKILSSRAQNLEIVYNVITTSRLWEKV